MTMHEKPAASPVAFYGWTIVAVTFFSQMLSSGVTQALYPILVVPLEHAFDASRAQVMAATASMALLGSGILSPIIGIAMQKQSVAKWMLVGAVALIIGFCLLSQATALWQVALIYLVCWSLGSAALGPLSANTLVNNWFVERRGMALGVSAMGISCGAFFFPPGMSWLITQLDWRQACFVIAGLVSFVIPIILFFAVDRPEQRGQFPDGKTEAPKSEGQAALDIKSLLKVGNFWWITLSVGCCFACFSGVMVNLVPMAIDQGTSAQKAAFLMSFSAVLSIIGKGVIGFASDKISPRVSLAIPMCSMIVACLILRGDPDYNQMAVGSCFLGLAAGGTIPVWGALIGRYFGREAFPMVMGMMNPLFVPLIIMGPITAAYINDQFGSYDNAFVMFIIVMLVALLISSRLSETSVGDGSAE